MARDMKDPRLCKRLQLHQDDGIGWLGLCFSRQDLDQESIACVTTPQQLQGHAHRGLARFTGCGVVPDCEFVNVGF